MESRSRRLMEANLRKWDESVPLHVQSPVYDVPAFLRGANTLQPLERRELRPVRGRTLLHLQCHFGLDTLSWARLGARVTGVDFSPTAVRTARSMAERAGLEGRFVESNIYDVPRRLREQFDIVYTAKGALCWLPDLRRWAKIVRGLLRPGGTLYVLEDHPIADACRNEPGTRRLEFELPYFLGRAHRDQTDGTYATRVRMRYRTSYMWIHPLSELLTAIAGAGLELDFLHEFPYCYWKKFPVMRRYGKEGWQLTRGAGTIPLMYSLRAHAPRLSSTGTGRGSRG
ncbi:MAG: methyltransferase domain-containing protein [Thermoplasmata archaeon]|nr:methyltransferase domain-containing protein [Thermoplasmata archaeon]